MADVQQFLTRKAGPLPVWGWAAAGGGLLAVLYLRGKSQAQAPTGAQGVDTSGTGPFAPSPIIVTPNTMPDSTSSANPPPPPGVPAGMQTVVITGAWAQANGQPRSDTGVWARPSPTWDAEATRLVPLGTRMNVHAQPIRTASGKPSGLFWYQTEQGDYVMLDDVNVVLQGMGGAAASAVKTLAGAGRVGRFSSPHAHRQFLNVGMGGGPHALKAVAGRTGIPEIRLMALNPGHWRPTPGGRPRHIQIG